MKSVLWQRAHQTSKAELLQDKLTTPLSFQLQLIFIQTSNSNPSLRNLVKEGNSFAKFAYRWVNRYLNQLALSSWADFLWCDANPLSLLPCLCCCLLVFVLSSLCVTYAHACIWIIHDCHAWMHIPVRACVCAMLHLPPLLACLPLHLCTCLCVCMCVCPSHPARAIHLYMSQTSIEIDSSDGMISDPSTKDPSSSEDEGPSSDDDDGGDDSDWGGGDRQRETLTLMWGQPGSSLEGCPDGTRGFDPAEARWRDEERDAAAAVIKNSHIVPEFWGKDFKEQGDLKWCFW